MVKYRIVDTDRGVALFFTTRTGTGMGINLARRPMGAPAGSPCRGDWISGGGRDGVLVFTSKASDFACE